MQNIYLFKTEDLQPKTKFKKAITTWIQLQVLTNRNLIKKHKKLNNRYNRLLVMCLLLKICIGLNYCTPYRGHARIK